MMIDPSKESAHHEASALYGEKVALNTAWGKTTKPKEVTMENVMQHLGVPGRFQLIQIIATCFCVTPFAFVMLNFVFIGYEPSATCSRVNETQLFVKYNLLNYSELRIGYKSCAITITVNSSRSDVDGSVTSIECENGFYYQEHEHVSMVTDWDMVCDKRGIVEIVQTAIALGMTLSSAFVTVVVDSFGRKWVFMASICTIMITELALVFADNLYITIVLRFFTGLSAGAMYAIHNVISSELIITKYRHIYGQCNCILWSSNVMLLSGIAYALRDNSWKHLQLTTALCGIPALLAAFILKETPLWYFSQGRYEDTKSIVIRVCKTNGKNVRELLRMVQKCITNATVGPASRDILKKGAKYSLLDILLDRNLRGRVLILCLTWFTNGSTYFGLYLSSSTLAGDRYLNFFLMALMEIPSALICIFLLAYLGRRTVVLIFIALSGVCLSISTYLLVRGLGKSDEADASTAFFLLAKFAIGSSYNVLAAYTPELLPTTIRSTGTGLCASLAYLGAMLAPFLIPLFKIIVWAPGAILTGMCLVSFFVFLMIPETRGRQPPTTIGEIRNWE